MLKYLPFGAGRVRGVGRDLNGYRTALRWFDAEARLDCGGGRTEFREGRREELFNAAPLSILTMGFAP
jgi:hypothetical protein